MDASSINKTIVDIMILFITLSFARNGLFFIRPCTGIRMHTLLDGSQLPECLDVLAVLIFFQPPLSDVARISFDKQVSPFSFYISPGINQWNSKKIAHWLSLSRRIFRLSSFYKITREPPGIKHDKMDGEANGCQVNPAQPVAVI